MCSGPPSPIWRALGEYSRPTADLMPLQVGLPAPEYRFSGPGAKSRHEEYPGAVMAGYLPDKRAKGTQAVPEQAELLCADVSVG